MPKFKHDKNLGQHFLIDEDVINWIITAAGDLSNTTVIEIGPGNLSLTKQLVKKAKSVFAIELDKRLTDKLELFKEKNNNFDYIIADALKFNPKKIESPNKVLISNLPYNVGTQIYLNYLNFKNEFSFFILMFQLEVAKRITASAGDKHYGRLSVISDLLARRELLFNVKKDSFSPPPQVESAVIKIIPFIYPRIDVDIKKLEYITNLAFQGRRKTLKNSLKILNLDLENLGIDDKKRAEDISLEEFCKIATSI